MEYIVEFVILNLVLHNISSSKNVKISKLILLVIFGNITNGNGYLRES